MGKDEKKEELLQELEYFNQVIANMDEHDGDLSFVCYQRNELEKELEELEAEDDSTS